MKLVFFLYSLSSGGAERVTATLANFWAGKGWQVVVVTAAGRELDFYTLDSRVERIALNMAFQSRNAGQALWHNLRRVWALRRILHHEKPDIAVAMMPTADVTLALAGHLAGISSVGSERTYPPAMPLGRAWESLRRLAYPLLDCMVAQTQVSADWLEANAPTQRIRVIPNPLRYPLERHEPVVDPHLVRSSLAGEHLLLAVGRLGEEKRFERLIAAFALVCEKHHDWSLVILGQGPLHQALLEQAEELGISDRVALPGAVGNVGDWFEAADLYTLTSRFEGFPNTLVEALAYGVPSVAVDCETGPREILRHEVDGLLVPQDDLDALVTAFDRLMGDADLRSRFAERAVEARDRFAVGTVGAAWEELFEEILK